MGSLPDDPVDLVEHISMCTPPSGVRMALLQQDTPPGRHEQHDGIVVGWVGVSVWVLKNAAGVWKAYFAQKRAVHGPTDAPQQLAEMLKMRSQQRRG